MTVQHILLMVKQICLKAVALWGCKLFTSVLFCLIFVAEVNAQSFWTNLAAKRDSIDYNTEYIKSYSETFTSRMFMSRRYTNLRITDEIDGAELRYEPNTSLNLGVGATVNSVSLNLSYGFKYLNPENNKGKTRNLDLQSHIYMRSWVVDLYAQFYKGLYLENTHELAPDYPEDYYTRGDIYQQLLGGSALYLFNNQKFSYRAPFIQNERQMKSAGSFLLGAEVGYGIVRADSALLPSFEYAADLSEMDSIPRVTFFKAGPSVGYVYSLVIAKKFFATLSLTLNTNYSANFLYHQRKGTMSNIQFNISGIARWAIGYNDDNWYLGLMSVNATAGSANQDRSVASEFGVGNFRLNFVWRFLPGPKLKKYMEIVP